MCEIHFMHVKCTKVLRRNEITSIMLIYDSGEAVLPMDIVGVVNALYSHKVGSIHNEYRAVVIKLPFMARHKRTCP